MSSRRVAPREGTVVASQLRRSQPSGPCVRFVDLALPRGAPPAVVQFLAFRNHYAYAVTVRARDAHGAWRDVLRDTRLMADPHYEDDATQIVVLELPGEGVSLDGQSASSCVRVYFSNPSPRWARVEVGASHFTAYESVEPEFALAELTRRVRRAIREARRYGSAGGESPRDEKKKTSSFSPGNRRARVARRRAHRARRHDAVGRPVSFRRARRVPRCAPRASRRGGLENENTLSQSGTRGVGRRNRRRQPQVTGSSIAR